MSADISGRRVRYFVPACLGASLASVLATATPAAAQEPPLTLAELREMSSEALTERILFAPYPDIFSTKVGHPDPYSPQPDGFQVAFDFTPHPTEQNGLCEAWSKWAWFGILGEVTDTSRVRLESVSDIRKFGFVRPAYRDNRVPTADECLALATSTSEWAGAYFRFESNLDASAASETLRFLEGAPNALRTGSATLAECRDDTRAFLLCEDTPAALENLAIEDIRIVAGDFLFEDCASFWFTSAARNRLFSINVRICLKPGLFLESPPTVSDIETVRVTGALRIH